MVWKPLILYLSVSIDIKRFFLHNLTVLKFLVQDHHKRFSMIFLGGLYGVENFDVYKSIQFKRKDSLDKV